MVSSIALRGEADADARNPCIHGNDGIYWSGPRAWLNALTFGACFPCSRAAVRALASGMAHVLRQLRIGIGVTKSSAEYIYTGALAKETFECDELELEPGVSRLVHRCMCIIASKLQPKDKDFYEWRAYYPCSRATVIQVEQQAVIDWRR